jgi:hypothetical protein
VTSPAAYRGLLVSGCRDLFAGLALYLYATMRWLVFRDVQRPAPAQAQREPNRLGLS